MNCRYSALAFSALAMGAVVLTTTEASAMTQEHQVASTSPSTPPPEWPDEGTGYPGSETKSPEYTYPYYEGQYEVPREVAVAQSPSNGRPFEGAQLGASAVGGAAVAFGAMWLYRRRHALDG
jgi:hypothetical protein